MQARAESDPQFARRVEQWERASRPGCRAMPSRSSRPGAWCGRRCGRASAGRPAEARPGLWQSLAFWRAATILASIAAVFAIWVAPRTGYRRHRSPSSSPQASRAWRQAVTTLAHDDGSPAWLASVDPARGTVLMVPVPHAADPQGRVPELWLIPPGQGAAVPRAGVHREGAHREGAAGRAGGPGRRLGAGDHA